MLRISGSRYYSDSRQVAVVHGRASLVPHGIVENVAGVLENPRAELQSRLRS